MNLLGLGLSGAALEWAAYNGHIALGGRRVALVVCADRAGKRLVFYQVNPATRMLEDVAGTVVSFACEPYG